MRRHLLIFALFLIIMPPSGWAAGSASAPVFLSASEINAHQETIDRIEDYLTNLTTVAADFTQVAPDGSLGTGKFYLKRPGKMRWQYNPPTPILMISSGTELVYYDSELEQVSHIPLDSTLIGFLAQDKIRLSGNGIGILNFEESADAIRVTVAQIKKPDEGQLTLEFSDAPLLIRNMIIRDATQQTTTVSLNNARFGEALDPELFIFRDPRKRQGAGIRR